MLWRHGYPGLHLRRAIVPSASSQSHHPSPPAFRFPPDPSERVALQLSLLITNIARFDFPARAESLLQVGWRCAVGAALRPLDVTSSVITCLLCDGSSGSMCEFSLDGVFATESTGGSTTNNHMRQQITGCTGDMMVAAPVWISLTGLHRAVPRCLTPPTSLP